MKQSLKLVWNSGHEATIQLADNEIAKYITKCVKHLKNIPLTFNSRENPLYTVGMPGIISQMKILGHELGIEIDQDRLNDQNYINALHNDYVSMYRAHGKSKWLELHDLIHVLEDVTRQDRHSIYIDYKDRAGPLIKPFDRDLLSLCQHDYDPGDCYVSAHELGKTFWTYYRDHEIDDEKNICELVRPWQWLKPVVNIAFKNIRWDELPCVADASYMAWKQRHLEKWREYHGLEHTVPGEEFARLPIGKLSDPDRVLELFSLGRCPDYLSF